MTMGGLIKAAGFKVEEFRRFLWVYHLGKV
jgi:hypothetical protein